MMQNTLFSSEETNGKEWYKFKMSPWGDLYKVLPLELLGKCLPTKSHRCGRKEYFDNAGKFALMFLKHQLNVSDEQLLAHINTNPILQLFCGMRLGDFEMITDTGIVSRIRGYIAAHTNLDQLQLTLLQHWKKDIDVPHFLKMDATCYESYIRYPTDVKLLWECCDWVYSTQLFPLRKSLGIRLGKQKERFDTQKKKYLSYSKLRRRGKKKTRRRIKSLLNLLDKGLSALQDLLDKFLKDSMCPTFYAYIRTIRKIYQQQLYLFKHQCTSVANRIVSLHKPYIRPIKRGKENKPVEFGAKVHMLQVGGLNVIEHLSFNAFNECKRLKKSVWFHQQLLGECHQVSADRIYATNENRRFCKANNVFHSFDPKGRKPDKATMNLKANLNKERATRLEGSFGNHKNHYGLDKVKARNQKNESLWIFMGVFTANAVYIAKKRARRKQDHEPLKQAA